MHAGKTKSGSLCNKLFLAQVGQLAAQSESSHQLRHNNAQSEQASFINMNTEVNKTKGYYCIMVANKMGNQGIKK